MMHMVLHMVNTVFSRIVQYGLDSLFFFCKTNWSFMVGDEIYIWRNTVVLALNYHTCMRLGGIKYRKNTKAKSENHLVFSSTVSSVLFYLFWMDWSEPGSSI